MRSFSVTSVNIAINDISLKTRFFGLHFRSVADCIGLYLRPLWRNRSESYRIGEKTQDNGHYTVQGHSRSPILVPIESAYATSLQIIGQICTFDRVVLMGYPSLTHSFGWTPKLRIMKLGLKKPETSLCPKMLNDRQTINSFCHNPRVWQTERRRTDGQTDRRTYADSKTVRMHS